MHVLFWQRMSLLVLIVGVLGHTVCCCFRVLFMARLQALLRTYWQKNPLWVCCCWAWTNAVVAVVPEVGFRVLILFVCWDCFAAVMWSNTWLWRSWKKVSGRKKRLSFLTWSGLFSITLIPFSPFLLASFRLPFHTPPIHPLTPASSIFLVWRWLLIVTVTHEKQIKSTVRRSWWSG